jgi:hypothetical protein
MSRRSYKEAMRESIRLKKAEASPKLTLGPDQGRYLAEQSKPPSRIAGAMRLHPELTQLAWRLSKCQRAGNCKLCMEPIGHGQPLYLGWARTGSPKRTLARLCRWCGEALEARGNDQ